MPFASRSTDARTFSKRSSRFSLPAERAASGGALTDRPPDRGGLHAIPGDIRDAIEEVGVPAYVIDPTGVIRWMNGAAKRLVGDACGRQFTSVVAPEETRRAREHFARKIAGVERVKDASVVVIDPHGGRTS